MQFLDIHCIHWCATRNIPPGESLLYRNHWLPTEKRTWMQRAGAWVGWLRKVWGTVRLAETWPKDIWDRNKCCILDGNRCVQKLMNSQIQYTRNSWYGTYFSDKCTNLSDFFICSDLAVEVQYYRIKPFSAVNTQARNFWLVLLAHWFSFVPCDSTISLILWPISWSASCNTK